jgi:multiple sugar transport system ATP-binding protein
MASVSLRRLAKRYTPDGRPALDALTLDVLDGELFALLGPSGSGKTTLLRCLAGLEEPSDGEILIGDREVTTLPPAERDVAMVFQTYALYPHLSVRGNIAFGLEVRRVPAAEVARRVQATAARLGLTPLRPSCPAVNASASPSAGRSCGSLASSCSTSRSRISNRACAPNSGPSCSSCIAT